MASLDLGSSQDDSECWYMLIDCLNNILFQDSVYSCTFHIRIHTVFLTNRFRWRFQKASPSCMWNMMWRAIPSFRESVSSSVIKLIAKLCIRPTSKEAADWAKRTSNFQSITCTLAKAQFLYGPVHTSFTQTTT